MVYINRRKFLTGTGALGMTAGMAGLGGLAHLQAANAADTTGYKALVCIFLKGGLDNFDTLLPYDQAGYDQLRGVRPDLFQAYFDLENFQANSPRWRTNLLELNPTNAGALGGRQFALPPEMSGMRDLFNTGELAVVGNVGPLIEPVTRTQYEAGTAALPARLFSHNDQQSTWMSLGIEGSQIGWGGKFADEILKADPTANPLFTAITANNSDVFLTGQNARQFRAATGGGATVELQTFGKRIGFNQFADNARARLATHLGRTDFGSDNLMERDYLRANARAIANTSIFADARTGAADIPVAFPNTKLADQLQTVAEAIQIRTQLGVSRQIFYVTIGGFDTHSIQPEVMPGLQQDINDSIMAFRSAMQALGEWNNVTLFTATEFGRTLIENGDGTDHGWGGHQFVAGGSVNGQQIYGTIPENVIGEETIADERGRLIPTHSVEQFAATLGKWLGLEPSELQSALPNLANFTEKDMGFLS